MREVGAKIIERLPGQSCQHMRASPTTSDEMWVDHTKPETKPRSKRCNLASDKRLKLSSPGNVTPAIISTYFMKKELIRVLFLYNSSKHQKLERLRLRLGNKKCQSSSFSKDTLLHLQQKLSVLLNGICYHTLPPAPQILSLIHVTYFYLKLQKCLYV